MTERSSAPGVGSKLIVVLAVLLAAGLGAYAGRALWGEREPELPDGPILVAQVREVMRLETLRVSLHKKVTFSPEPPAPSDSLWEDLKSWTRHTLAKPSGKVIVFAEARLGYDFESLGADDLRVERGVVSVRLPPLDVAVELEPSETEVIGSNLDTAETAQLMELAKRGFEREVLADEELRRRARDSAERNLRGLFLSVGYREVRFVDELPARAGSN